MSYKTNREKIKEVIQNQLFNSLASAEHEGVGLDYETIINELIKETGSSRKLVKEMLKIFIDSGELKEERIIYITAKGLDIVRAKNRLLGDDFDNEIKNVLGDSENEAKM